MSGRKILKSVLWNFLGTYTSRYSEFQMYWLFGFLVPELDVLEVDLLASNDGDASPTGAAIGLATQKFADQLRKARINRDRIRFAKLTITRRPEVIRRPVLDAWSSQQQDREGYDLTFAVEAKSVDDATFSVSRIVFVAPHDPATERQSCGGIPPDR